MTIARAGTPTASRVALVVCDSWGIGDAPDAETYRDSGADTLGNTARAVRGIHAPNLGRLGLGRTDAIEGIAPAGESGTAAGRLTERSAGKDTTTGHWEIAGIVLTEPFPTYPHGFPAEVIEPFERAIGREIIGNTPASGTEIIAELGEEQLRTGKPIVYTSGDSVFQIAAHTRVAPLAVLYEWSRSARRLLTGPHRVGRVIARPFDGEPGSFVRTPGRRDFSVPPPDPTLLDACRDAGVPVYAVGKIQDIFAGAGVTEGRYSDDNDHGIDLTLSYLRRPGPSLVFANLVDFDSKYGHRNDPEGYARCIEALDRRVPELLAALGEDGILLLTGDHGCDPTTPSTDHTRERTPVLAAGLAGDAVEIGTRPCFADLGATIADLLGVEMPKGTAGESFRELLRR
jgi:phosphopentomutase